MSAIPPDYDANPGRTTSWSSTWVRASPTWDEGAGRFVAEHLAPVLDLGCGLGGYASRLPPAARWIGLDASPTMLASLPPDHRGSAVQADARRLPFHDNSVGGVVCRNMLYHLDEPLEVIAEAYRVLRPGGLFLAETRARAQDPELVPEGYPASTFDAEEAPDIVARIFGGQAVEVERWDGPYVVLPDAEAVASYARHHGIGVPENARFTTPLTLTKRGCLVWARKAA